MKEAQIRPNYPAIALSLALTAILSDCRSALAQDSSEWMKKVGALNVDANTALEQLQNGLFKAKNFADFSELNKSLEARTFGRETNLPSVERKKLADIIDQIAVLLKTTDASSESIRCQALVARYFVTIKANDKGEFHYARALKRSERTWQGVANSPLALKAQPPAAANLENGCKTALALLYLKKGKVDPAEKFYREVINPWHDLSGPEKEKMIRQKLPFGTFLPGQAALAGSLGQAYEKAGKNDEALKHYSDMLAFETFVLDSGYLDPRASIVPAVVVPVQKPRQIQADFDPLIGVLPDTETLITPYLRFAQIHPELVKPTQRDHVKEQLQLVLERRRSQANSKSNFAWRSREVTFLDDLIARPQLALSQLKSEIETRRAKDNNDPIIAYSNNAIGMRLTHTGHYAEAAQYLQDSIATREKQGPAGRFALGASLTSLGCLYIEQGKIAAARPILERAYKLRQGDPVDKFAQAKTQVAIGRLLVAEGKQAEGESELKKAAAILRAATESQNTSESHSFDAAKESMELYTERNAVKNAEHKSGRVYYALAQLELATLYIKQNKLDAAEDLLKPLRSQVAGTTDLWLEARVNEKLGRIAMVRGDLIGAEEKLKQAETAVKEHSAAGRAAMDISQARSELQARRQKLRQLSK